MTTTFCESISLPPGLFAFNENWRVPGATG